MAKSSPASGCAAGRSVGQQQHRVVGAHVAVDADAIETVARGRGERSLGRGRREGGVGHDQRQHGGHVRAHHRRAFGHAGDLNFAAVDRHGPAGQFVDRVGGQHAAGGRKQTGFVAAQFHGGRGDALLDLVHRQKGADHAGRKHQRLIGLGAAGGGRQAGHFLGVAQAALAGAGVGHARANHHGADPIARRAAAIERHRGGADQVLRVNARRRSRRLRHDQRQILLLRIALDAAMNAGQKVSLGNANRHDFCLPLPNVFMVSIRSQAD